MTGGAGFLGSHLCDGLLGEGYSVVAADNLLTGRLANIEHLRNDSRFEFVEKDVCQPGEWGTLDFIMCFTSRVRRAPWTMPNTESNLAGGIVWDV